MFNDEKRLGFSKQGAWIRVFRHLECIQKMEERKVRQLIFLNLSFNKPSILVVDVLVNDYFVSFGFTELFCH